MYKLTSTIIQSTESPLSSNQKLVLIVLADAYNEKKKKVWLSQKTIAARSSLTRQTVNTIVKQLREMGLIRLAAIPKELKGKSKYNMPLVVTINLDAWDMKNNRFISISDDEEVEVLDAETAAAVLAEESSAVADVDDDDEDIEEDEQEAKKTPEVSAPANVSTPAPAKEESPEVAAQAKKEEKTPEVSDDTPAERKVYEFPLSFIWVDIETRGLVEENRIHWRKLLEFFTSVPSGYWDSVEEYAKKYNNVSEEFLEEVYDKLEDKFDGFNPLNRSTNKVFSLDECDFMKDIIPTDDDIVFLNDTNRSEFNEFAKTKGIEPQKPEKPKLKIGSSSSSSSLSDDASKKVIEDYRKLAKNKTLNAQNKKCKVTEHVFSEELIAAIKDARPDMSESDFDAAFDRFLDYNKGKENTYWNKNLISWIAGEHTDTFPDGIRDLIK